MEVRQAKIDDGGGIAKVQVNSYQTAYAGILPSEYLKHFTLEEQEQDWRDWLSSDKGVLIFVAVTNNNEISGYASGKCNGNEIMPYDSELIALHVRKKYQKQGVGRRLVGTISKALYFRGCKSLFLWVIEDNPNRNFYEKLGGKLVGKKPWQNNDYFGTNLNEVAYGWVDIRNLFIKGA